MPEDRLHHMAEYPGYASKRGNSRRGTAAEREALTRLSMQFFARWQFDPSAIAAAVAVIVAYGYAVRAFELRRGKRWPALRMTYFFTGIASGLVALESPLDAAGDARFAPHMVQHLILADVTAPFLLLGGPLLLALGATPPRVARTIVAVLRSKAAHVLAFPLVTWFGFIIVLWTIHFSGFFEAALEHEPLHVLEHALLLATSLLFWLPVIAIGPTPWVDGPLAFPLRMLYLIVAMPAAAMLGFALYSARHVLYPHYAAAGLADQQNAGEIMWVGGALLMFAAFMLVGYEWAQHEQRLGTRLNARS